MNELDQNEVSMLLDLVYQRQRYDEEESWQRIATKLWKMERILDIRTDKALRGAE
tara:strand:+ start:298 stop:462 length:165 start_codon:yes stop_codon:yes gene_type:complete